jgi:hypothetical protein
MPTPVLCLRNPIMSMSIPWGVSRIRGVGPAVQEHFTDHNRGLWEASSGLSETFEKGLASVLHHKQTPPPYRTPRQPETSFFRILWLVIGQNTFNEHPAYVVLPAALVLRSNTTLSAQGWPDMRYVLATSCPQPLPIRTTPPRRLPLLRPRPKGEANLPHQHPRSGINPRRRLRPTALGCAARAALQPCSLLLDPGLVS